MNDFSLSAFIANLGKYNEGELIGEWVRFPVRQEDMEAVLDRIGMGKADPFGNVYDELFITDMTTNAPKVGEILTHYENIEKLNYYAACVQALSENEYAKYKAVLEGGQRIPENGIDGLINLTFNLDRYDVLPSVRNEDGISLRPMTEQERMYSYSQSSQIEGQTGLIGHLRGDMDFDGSGFFTSWTDHRADLKTDEFKAEFDTVINALRSDPAFGGVLKNRSSLNRYGHNHPESAFSDDYFSDFGFRADTEKYSYFLRVNGRQGDYNLYCYAYYRPWLEQHLNKAKAGIRFITPEYEEKFRLPDGGRIEVTDWEGETKEHTCRYIDDYHFETSGGGIYHICEFAERLQMSGSKVRPLSPTIDVKAQSRQPKWKKIYDSELDSIPEEYRLPTAKLEELKDRVIQAMKLAGYEFNSLETDYGCIRFNGETQVVFGGWKEAEVWLENAFVDDPVLCKQISEVFHKGEPEEMTVLVIEPKKEPYVKTIPSGLESLQREVGGYIEAVYPFSDPVALICNEEGKLEGLALNRGIYDDAERLYDIVCGTMLVVGLGEDNFSSLSPDLLEKYMDYYKQPEMFIRVNDEMRAYPIIDAGKEEADRLAADIVKLFEMNGFEGYVNAPSDQVAKTSEAFSVILRSGEDYPLRRNLLEIAESGSDSAKEAAQLISQLDSFYLSQGAQRFELYQLRFEGENIRNLCFRSYDELQAEGRPVDAGNYTCVYSGKLRDGETLDGIYERFNLQRPKDFLGHSLSVSDVIVTSQNGQQQAFYVDSFGFKEAPEFLDRNPLAKVEELLEDDYGMIDGIINNGDKAKDQERTKLSLLERLQEKKEEANDFNRNRQAPNKSRAQDLGLS